MMHYCVTRVGFTFGCIGIDIPDRSLISLYSTSRPVGLRKETVRKRLRKAEIVGKSSGGGKRLKS